MKAFITGGAGFIGSNLADRLLEQGHEVVVYDNFITGFRHFVDHNLNNPKFQLIEGDVMDRDLVISSSKGCDIVFHFQANADVRGGIKNTEIDLQQNIIGTHNVLEAVRINEIKKIAFSSSATVYGEPEIFPTPEDISVTQTSIYGASKYSAEALIQAYSEYFDVQCWMFRFVSFIGQRYTHGVIFDFVKKLQNDPTQLEILGDGEQRKSYLSVQDGVAAMLQAVSDSKERVNVLNLGHDDFMNVKDLARIIIEEMGLKEPVQFNFTGGKRGWVGDSPFVHLDTAKMKRLGWAPKISIEQGIRQTVNYLMSNPQLLVRD